MATTRPAGGLDVVAGPGAPSTRERSPAVEPIGAIDAVWVGSSAAADGGGVGSATSVRWIGQDVDHDHRDVVLPACFVRQRHEPVRRVLWVGRGAQDQRDPVLGKHQGESVRAEDEPVAVVQRQRQLVDIHLVVDAERAGDDAPLWVAFGVLRGEPALPDQLLHDRVGPLVNCWSAPRRKR